MASVLRVGAFYKKKVKEEEEEEAEEGWQVNSPPFSLVCKVGFNWERDYYQSSLCLPPHPTRHCHLEAPGNSLASHR